MPGIGEAIFSQLGIEPTTIIPDVWDFNSIAAGHKIGTPKPLFSIIPSSKIEEWQLAYGGEELKRQKALQAEKAAAKAAAKKAKKQKSKEKKDKEKEAGGPAPAPAPAETVAKEVADLSLKDKN
uniref:Uncharacterized protein n=1 Tax=Bionectria ochroleuca TaxID=29856 RepID=A0A8H7NA71_BIOOC